MKKKSVKKNGRYLSPTLPIEGITTSLRRKTIIISIKLPKPLGTFLFELLLAAYVRLIINSKDATSIINTLLVIERSSINEPM
jgi:hypothetical protein